MPTISIVTPAYNAAAHIGETVRAALQQTYGDFELLVVDDSSLDDTVAVVAGLAREDARVRLLRHERNAGPAAARNTALAAAGGRFVSFLDSDDLWRPGKLERQLSFMKDSGAAFSYTAYSRIDERGRPLSGTLRVPARLEYRSLLKNTAIMTSTVMIDREQTGPWRMKATYYDDFACWLEITRRGFAAVALPEDLMAYRVVRGSVSRDKWRSARHIWRVHREVERLPLPYAFWCWAHYAWNAVRKHYLVRTMEQSMEAPGR